MEAPMLRRLCVAVLSCSVLSAPCAADQPGNTPSIAFVLQDRELIPEGIAYDPSSRTFFVGSTYERKIVAVDADGRARDFTSEKQDGLWGLVGMKVDAPRRLLWA